MSMPTSPQPPVHGRRAFNAAYTNTATLMQNGHEKCWQKSASVPEMPQRAFAQCTVPHITLACVQGVHFWLGSYGEKNICLVHISENILFGEKLTMPLDST